MQDFQKQDTDIMAQVQKLEATLLNAKKIAFGNSSALEILSS